MKCKLSILFLLSVVLLSAQSISDYDVSWTTPSGNSSGSMPLGNGELGMNVWVEEQGDVCFYLSRTDAMSEANRLMKLGRIRISIDGNPFADAKFSQRLNLKDGVIEISGGNGDGQCTLKLYMDPDNEVAYAVMNSHTKRVVKLMSESWRREPHIITKAESVSAWTTHPLPDNVKLTESADVFQPQANSLCWYHQNKESVYDLTMKHQEKTAYKASFPDPITNRLFGCYVTSPQLKVLNDSTLTSGKEVNKVEIQLVTLSKQVETPKVWLDDIRKIAKSSKADKALRATNAWWNKFWERSYIYVETPGEKELGHKISQAYALQRFMAAGSGRGAFPIKFNGSIFTVEPVYTNGMSFPADYRNWGNDFWWQNTRLPYYAMLSSGDFDMMEPLFDFYLDRFDAFRTLASKYYGVKGIFIPETTTIFGTYANGDWGWDRTGLTSNDVVSPWIGKIWVQGLELSKLMIDYYKYTQNEAFLVEKVFPTLYEVLLYFDTRFINESGKMTITPTQSLETYWFNVENDMPCVAGLHYLMKEIKGLPADGMNADLAGVIERVQKSLPALPVKNTAKGQVFMPASVYLEKLSNVENPELYPVFPFGLANFTNDLGKVGKRSFERRIFNSGFGWGQDGQHAAILGLVDETVENLKSKIDNTNKNQRFLAMWGPNYDWVPDQDHGSNLLMVLQLMVLQHYDGKNYVLPTWPEKWNVSFKLAVPGGETLEGVYKQGKLQMKADNPVEYIHVK